MNLMNTVRGAVALADKVTASLRVEIQHEAWTGQSETASPTYAGALPIEAIVEQGPVTYRTTLGETIVLKAIVHILRPVDPNGATGRQEPIDPRDRITLPNGVVGAPIMGLPAALVDPDSDVPYYFSIGLG